jgi:hypothetical protein
MKMKMLSALTTCAALALGASAALAHPVAYTTMGATYTVNAGQTSGPVVIHNPTVPTPTTAVINNGTINGGTSAGITITGSTPTTTTNNGKITSSKQGISVSGGTSSTVINDGSITVVSTNTSATTATSTAAGIVITSGP